MLILQFGWIAFQVIGLVILADFVVGVIHWALDTLGSSKTPIWGPLFVQPNEYHHAKPADISKIHWLWSNRHAFSIAIGLSVFVALMGWFTWQFALFALVGGSAQQAHRFAHMPVQSVPRPVRWLQHIGALQTVQAHWRHHRAPTTSHYCVITKWVNPVLENIGFWRSLEKAVVPILGAPRRPDLKYLIDHS